MCLYLLCVSQIKFLKWFNYCLQFTPHYQFPLSLPKTFLLSFLFLCLDTNLLYYCLIILLCITLLAQCLHGLNKANICDSSGQHEGTKKQLLNCYVENKLGCLKIKSCPCFNGFSAGLCKAAEDSALLTLRRASVSSFVNDPSPTSTFHHKLQWHNIQNFRYAIQNRVLYNTRVT